MTPDPWRWYLLVWAMAVALLLAALFLVNAAIWWGVGPPWS